MDRLTVRMTDYGLLTKWLEFYVAMKKNIKSGLKNMKNL